MAKTGELIHRILADLGHLVGASVALCFLIGTVTAQTSSTDGSTPLVLTAGAPSGSYAMSGFDNINVFNGSLNFHLPIDHLGGRGDAQYTMVLPIETHWRVLDRSNDYQEIFLPTDYTWYGDKPGYGPGVLLGRAAATDPSGSGAACVHYPSYSYSSLTRLTFILPDGTEYEFRDQATGGQQKISSCYANGYNRGTVFVTADGSAATFVSDTPIYDTPGTYNTYPSGYLSLRNGLRYRIDQSHVSWMRDRNGNKLTFTPQNGSTLITDSLNRQVTISYADFQTVFYDQITFKGFGGAQRTIRVNYSAMHNVLRTNRPGDLSSVQTKGALFPELTGSSSTPYDPYKVSSVVLPDGVQQFQFLYNVYGELARVVLPTGGMFEYDFKGDSYDGNPDGVYGYPEPEIFRRVSEKRVYRDANNQENKTVFNGGTVDQFDPSGTILLSREKHYFYGGPTGSSAGGPPPFDYPAWNDGKEYQTEIIDTANCTPSTCATVLRRTVNVWQQGCTVSPWSSAIPNNPRVIETDSTLVDTNQVAKHTFAYDCFNNKTDTYEYDFGSGVAGALMRYSHADYVTATSYIDGVTGAHLRSLPIQASVFDANGIERARTTNEYDNYTPDGGNHAGLIDRPSISGLDSSFTTSYLTRGNATATTHYLFNTSGSVTGSISGYAQYDIAGNVVTAIDARGYATTFDYRDNFGASDEVVESFGEPANMPPADLAGQTSYAFPFKVTNALGHIAYSKYDYNLGRSVGGEDANGIVSRGYFNDALDRPTQIIRAANNLAVKSQTSFSYDDVNRVITTTSDQNTFNDNALKGQTVYDGLGRTVESRQYESGTNYIAAQTQYDALGRAYKSSNPFRPWNSESPIWTTSAFDALGRVISITTPDSAVVTTSYSANTVTVTDQTGKQRKSVTDGLGRLIQVYEDPNGLNYLTSYSYDTLDNLITVNQGSQTRSFVYDSVKRLTSATNPESGTLGYQYDNNGNLLSKTDARSIITNLAYDALNRVTSRSYQNDPNNTPAVSYSYDPNIANGKGRLGSVSSSVSTYTYGSYDAMGRATGTTQTLGSQSYSISNVVYDRASHVTSMAYPSGHTVTYAYDNAGRMNDFRGYLGDGALRVYSTGISYDSASHWTREQFGTTTPLYNKRHYNIREQLYDMRASTVNDDSNWNRGAIINYYNFQNFGFGTSGTDNNGNLLIQQHWIPTDDQLSGYTIHQQNYAYDSLNRINWMEEYLNAALPATGGQSFNYDRYGNRATSNTWGTGTSNQQFSVDGNTNRIGVPAGQSGTMSYDSAGNLTTDTYSAAAVARVYDAENRMTSETQANNYVAGSYSYDSDGRRVKRVVNGTETWQVYGLGGELIAEYAQNGAPNSPQKEYGYRNGQLLITATVTTGWGSPPILNDNPLSVGQTSVQARHITELRAAINALRSHLGMSAYSWQYSATTNDYISANPILEMRTALDQALGAPSGGYSAGLAQGQLAKAIHIQELRDRVLAAWQSGSSTQVNWLVGDQLGTPRMIFDQSGSLANISRHDYLPFGEELFAGTSGRSTAQGYTNSDGGRQKFTGYEADSETQLNFAQARYQSAAQGRFTTADPLGASMTMGNPQSFNRYSYVVNNPVNLTDPTGLVNSHGDSRYPWEEDPWSDIPWTNGGQPARPDS